MPYDSYSGCYYQDPNGLPGYDEWKLRSPYDEYEEEEECRHDEYEINWEGRAVCDHCHETWWATAEEIKVHDDAVRRAEREYQIYEREERRRNSWWMRAWRWLTVPHQRIVPDDDIPF